MQYKDGSNNPDDCHSESLRDSLAMLMRDPEARRLMQRAATRGGGTGDPSQSSEDLISDVACAVLAGDIVRDDRPLLAQLVAEIGNRGRALRRQQRRSAPIVSLDSEHVPDVVDPSTEAPEVAPRDSIEIMNAVCRRAQNDPLVLRLVAIHFSKGRIRRRDALAAGFSDYQYRSALGRLTSLCRAVAAAQRQASEVDAAATGEPLEVITQHAQTAARCKSVNALQRAERRHSRRRARPVRNGGANFARNSAPTRTDNSPRSALVENRG